MSCSPRAASWPGGRSGRRFQRPPPEQHLRRPCASQLPLAAPSPPAQPTTDSRPLRCAAQLLAEACRASVSTWATALQVRELRRCCSTPLRTSAALVVSQPSETRHATRQSWPSPARAASTSSRTRSPSARQREPRAALRQVLDRDRAGPPEAAQPTWRGDGEARGAADRRNMAFGLHHLRPQRARHIDFAVELYAGTAFVGPHDGGRQTLARAEFDHHRVVAGERLTGLDQHTGGRHVA